MPTVRLSKLFALAGVLTMLASMTPALAAPRRPALGPFIEDSSYYEGQTKCSPYAKPGVVSFQRMVLAAYPGTGAGSISRDCSVGGTSEHKEGRAWDWGVNVANASQRAAANDLLAWLAAEDSYGNRAAMARRLGVMYAIWNKRIWFPGSGWSTYCVDRRGACRDPEDGDVRQPHTDHVHFSFTWDGANKRTSFWSPKRTYASAATASPSGGLWVAGLNGGVRALGPTWVYGSKTGLDRNVIDIESTPSSDGYWLLASHGRTFAFGNARALRSPSDIRAADMATTASGGGYWILARGGRVLSYGDAKELGSGKAMEGTAVALEPTPTGRGYWIVWSTGAVQAIGDAQHFGEASGDAVDIAATATGLGYWIAMADGQVRSFGDAPKLGTVAKAPAAGIAALVPTPSGAGYWLVDAKAHARPFGDASAVRGSAAGAFAATSIDALTTITE
ncbi:MAG: hypothetical protein ACLGIB_10405 [Actinomycetota bacterium]